jgi:hypothetical protein
MRTKPLNLEPSAFAAQAGRRQPAAGHGWRTWALVLCGSALVVAAALAPRSSVEPSAKPVSTATERYVGPAQTTAAGANEPEILQVEAPPMVVTVSRPARKPAKPEASANAPAPAAAPSEAPAP